MVRRQLTVAASRTFVKRSERLEGWAKARRPLIITVVLSVSIGLLEDLPFVTDFGWLTAHRGPAAMWTYLAGTVPPGWAVGIMTYTVLKPRVLGVTGRKVTVSRYLLWSTLAALLLEQIPSLRYAHRLDTLLLSGWLVLLIGLELAAQAPVKLDKALQRLGERKVLDPPENAQSLKDILRQAWRRWWVVSGSCVAGALLATSPWFPRGTSGLRISTLGDLVSLSVFFAVGGAAAGTWLGRLVSYGRLLSKKNLHEHKLELRVIPGHPDGAGGLKPLGDFHLYQSLTASLPAIFLAVWVLLFSLGGPNPLWGGYGAYLDQYLLLLVLAVLFEVLVFILPMNSIHAVMKAQKESRFLPEADRLFPATAMPQAGLDNQPNAGADAARQRVIEKYKELEEAPTWPVDSSIRRRFTLRNLGFLIPFAGYFVGHMQFWQQLSDTFKGLG